MYRPIALSARINLDTCIIDYFGYTDITTSLACSPQLASIVRLMASAIHYGGKLLAGYQRTKLEPIAGKTGISFSIGFEKAYQMNDFIAFIKNQQ